ncbi:hypothetical protein EPUS_05011 [Endocarpon pusillum Z07020]|uniref:Uncharacterized protein n=1 Tax=Endocarpon pusillum (strain Z07020 / HMAS-L-300199) TaxID=1263415 RepID=U1HR27_ENDPU|nr:uncharacterized protein EPUS_05011 [Endocarpon pusillum Z07020]ERF72930.1 hypothetical protein EPUS_05011 [Endocarpon pusillum Z07020]
MVSGRENQSGWTETSPLLADQATNERGHEMHLRDAVVDHQQENASKRDLISIPGISLGQVYDSSDA